MFTRIAFLRTAAALALGIAAIAGAPSVQAATELTVYTAYENDDLAAYKKGFEADNPGIVINWVRDSTGVIAAKLLAEKNNVRADVVWGLAATNLDALKNIGLLLPYAPPGLSAIPVMFRDPGSPPQWFGNSGWICAITFNEIEGKKRNLPKPQGWKDLINPIYRGQIVMPHPGSSGTGFMYVSAWLQAFGEEAGWKYMDALHQNIAMYTHSGSAPATMSARGERVIGMSLELRASRLKQDGAPIDILMPKDALGWEMNGFAIMKGSKKLDAARKLADWAASEKAMRIYGATRAIVAMPGTAATLPFIPADVDQRVMKQDFAWASANNARILDEWERRYGGKAEPRKK